MRKSMDAKRLGALAVLPLFLVAAPLAASAEETLTTPGAESTMPEAVAAPAEAAQAPKAGATAEAVGKAATDAVAAAPANENTVPSAVADQDLIGKPVMGADGKQVGKVAAIKADKSGQLLAVHIETGGYFGFWTTLRKVPAGEFTSTGDGIKLGLASSEIETLSKVETPKG